MFLEYTQGKQDSPECKTFLCASHFPGSATNCSPCSSPTHRGNINHLNTITVIDTALVSICFAAVPNHNFVCKHFYRLAFLHSVHKQELSRAALIIGLVYDHWPSIYTTTHHGHNPCIISAQSQLLAHKHVAVVSVFIQLPGYKFHVLAVSASR